MASLVKQRGVALFVAMLILPLLLVLGVLVMSNSFLGLKMVDARVLKGDSNLILSSISQELMHQPDIATKFAQATNGTFSIGVATDASNPVEADVEVNGELNCRRRMKASGSNFKCRYLELELNHNFGRKTTAGAHVAKNSMGLGVEQPIIVE